eukprot:PhM_4_TR18077/c0_g1_i1/m.44691
MYPPWGPEGTKPNVPRRYVSMPVRFTVAASMYDDTQHAIHIIVLHNDAERHCELQRCAKRWYHGQREATCAVLGVIIDQIRHGIGSEQETMCGSAQSPRNIIQSVACPTIRVPRHRSTPITARRVHLNFGFTTEGNGWSS